MNVKKWKKLFVNNVIMNIVSSLDQNGGLYDILYYNNDNMLNNISGPAYIKWHTNGKKIYEKYCINDERNNFVCGSGKVIPASTEWLNIHGYKSYEKYYTNNKLNNFTREDGVIIPACVCWYNNNKTYEGYYIDGKLNNYYDGNNVIPAVTIWYNNGNEMREEYWEDGVFIRNVLYPN